MVKNDEIKANTCIETLHSRYNNKTIAKYEFEGADRINIRLDFDARLEMGSEIVLTKDVEGENIIKRINQSELELIKQNDNEDIELKTSKFYIHYPHQPS